MIQTVLVMAALGLAIAHLYLWVSTRGQEGFNATTSVDADAIWHGINDPGSARKIRLRQKVGGRGLDAAGMAELENPTPYHPTPTGRETPQTRADGLPVTPYLNFKAGPENNQEDAYADDDPLDLPWIASWSVADRYARRGQNCAVKYTEEGPDGTTIMTVSKSCESEMPHTRAGDRIAIPDTIQGPFKAEILAHELVHIYQHRYPTEWLSFYQGQWGFVFHDEPPPAMPPSVTEARRSNPDTWTPAAGGPWTSWQGRYWPVPVYTNPKMPTLRAAVTIWWDNQEHKVLTSPPPGWTAFFGSPSQDEHPHEISAVLIVSEDTETEAGRRLMNWWHSKTPIFRPRRILN